MSVSNFTFPSPHAPDHRAHPLKPLVKGPAPKEGVKPLSAFTHFDTFIASSSEIETGL